MSKFKICVCMATYNGSRYLHEQLDSILNQLADGDKLLISDDGSTDITVDILNEYSNRYPESVEIIGTSRTGGVVPNFCRVLSNACCEFVVLADQDDVWLPGRLDIVRSELQTFDLVIMNAIVVDSNLKKIEGMSLFEKLNPSVEIWPNIWKNAFVGCCMGFRRSLLSSILPMPRITPWHDWLIGLMACSVGTVSIINEPTLLYRRHDNNASPTGVSSSNGIIKKIILRACIILSLFVCFSRYLLKKVRYCSAI